MVNQWLILVLLFASHRGLAVLHVVRLPHRRLQGGRAQAQSAGSRAAWHCENEVVFWVVESMDWFKGKVSGNHGFYHQIWGFPVKFPLNQSIG